MNLKNAEIRTRAEKKLVKQIDHILGYTQDEHNHLINLYQANPLKITLIPPGVDTNRFRPISKIEAKKHIGIPAKHKLLLFIGRLDPIKGLENLLRAMSLLKLDPNDHCLAIIGGEKNDNSLKQIKHLAKRLKIGNLTVFLGSQDQRVLPHYYSAAEMTIIPSSHESFGLVALESMACGTPVIASRVGGLRYLIKHKKTGFLVPANKPQILAQYIKILLKQHHLRQKMGHSAHKSAQLYSWSMVTPQILKLYEKLL